MVYIISILIYLGIIYMNFRLYKGTSISLIFNVMWGFLSFFVYIFDLPRDENAYFYILSVNILFFIFYNIYNIGNLKNNRSYSYLINNKFYFDMNFKNKSQNFDKLNKKIVFLNIIGLVYLMYTLNFGISDFSSLGSLASKMNSISSTRYSQDVESLTLLNRVINSLVYAVCGYCGFFTNEKIKKEYFYNIILIAFQTIILNTKATLVFGLAFWVGGFLTGVAFYHRRIKFKHIVYSMLTIIFLLLFNTLVNYLRHNAIITFAEEFKKIIVAYFIGPFSAYNLWFKEPSYSTLELGINTFLGIFKFLGISPHVHGDFIMIDGISTNVYTVFKHLNNDYGRIGTVILFCFLGWISSLLENRVRFKKFTSVSLCMLVYSFILITFFSSIFRYNVNILAGLLIIIYSIPIKYH